MIAEVVPGIGMGVQLGAGEALTLRDELHLLVPRVAGKPAADSYPAVTELIGRMDEIIGGWVEGVPDPAPVPAPETIIGS